MPIYPYICDSCSYEFDRLQRIGDEPLRGCPECGAEALRRKLTAAAFHLKGSGWYETDFKNKEKPKEKKADAGEGDAKKPDAKTAETKSGGSDASGAAAVADTGKSKTAAGETA